MLVRPITSPIARSIYGGVVSDGGTPAFDPLSLGWDAFISAQSGMRLAGGAAAGDFGLVAQIDDLSGNGRHAIRSTALNQPQARVSDGLHLRGVAGDYASAPSSIPATADFVCSIAFRHGTISSQSALFSQSNLVVGINVNGSAYLALFGASTLSLISATGLVLSGNNYTLTVTRVGTFFELAIDGVAVASGSSTQSVTAASTLIGGEAASRPYSGVVYTFEVGATIGINFTDPADKQGAREITAATGQTVTLHGGAFLSREPSALFDGTNSWMTLNNPVTLNNAPGCTLLWVGQVLRTTGNNFLIALQTGTINTRAGIIVDSGTLLVGGRRLDADTFRTAGVTSPAVGARVVVAGVFSPAANHMTLYLDGEAVATQTYLTTGNFSPTNSVRNVLGAFSNDGVTRANYAQARYEVAAIASRVMTADEIAQLSAHYLAQ